VLVSATFGLNCAIETALFTYACALCKSYLHDAVATRLGNYASETERICFVLTGSYRCR